jgi:hypothetical protein
VESSKPFILPCCGCLVVIYSILVSMSLYVLSACGADGTLTDEASDELLLLYGCADAALEIAFVKHGGGLGCGISVRCMPSTFVS